MIQVYDLLRLCCGLSQQEAADFHQVRLDTVKSWCSDRRPAPQTAIDELKGLYRDILRAGEILAQQIQRLAPTIDDDGEDRYRVGLPHDEHDARACGWPCLAACEAAVAVAIAKIDLPARLIPRIHGAVPTAIVPDHELAPRSRSSQPDFMKDGWQTQVPAGPRRSARPRG